MKGAEEARAQPIECKSTIDDRLIVLNALTPSVHNGGTNDFRRPINYCRHVVNTFFCNTSSFHFPSTMAPKGVSRRVTTVRPKLAATSSSGTHAFTTMETKSLGLQGIADAKRESDRQYAKLLAGTR